MSEIKITETGEMQTIVSFDMAENDSPCIICGQTTNKDVRITCGYIGENAKILQRIVTEQGYLPSIDSINSLIKNNNINTDDISDGYHTFGQLYYQRMMLFATLVNLFPEISWKTRRHEDGEECFGGGWFLVTIETPYGNYGYHYEDKYWDKFNCPELRVAKHWDGYTEEDVTRLESLIRVKNFYGMILNKENREKFNSEVRESLKTCGRCIHDGKSQDIVGTPCYMCKRNSEDNRIDWFEERE